MTGVQTCALPIWHLEGVEDTLYELDKKGLPIGKKYGKAKIDTVQNDYGPGTISLKVNFGKLKTHINSSSDIDDLISHLNKKTGHNWYVSFNAGDTHIGTHTPLSLKTDIHHPWLTGFDEFDSGDDDDDRGGDRDKPKKPKSPSGPAFPTPTRPKTPALTWKTSKKSYLKQFVKLEMSIQYSVKRVRNLENMTAKKQQSKD